MIASQMPRVYIAILIKPPVLEMPHRFVQNVAGRDMFLERRPRVADPAVYPVIKTRRSAEAQVKSSGCSLLLRLKIIV
jgi:hypothetical protein